MSQELVLSALFRWSHSVFMTLLPLALFYPFYRWRKRNKILQGYTMSKGTVLGIQVSWKLSNSYMSSMTFIFCLILVLYLCCSFSKFRKFSLISLQIFFFWSLLLQLSFWDSDVINLDFLMFSHKRESASPLPTSAKSFFMLFRLDNSYWSFSNVLILCYLHSATQTIWKGFYFGYCIF